VADYLFVYGTLRPELAPPEVAAVMRKLESVGAGVIRGFLYDLGKYPGLRLDAQGNEVPGEIFQLSDPSILRALDAYEGYDPRNLKRSLFVRKECQAALEGSDEQLLCWVYEYNREPAASQRIGIWPPKK
jgi:gamma-glutamylcyclotransferase (GGCT)/AIG2-like uncharacterized protein YtfP